MNGNLESPRILFADDQEMIRLAYEKKLSGAGYDVDTVCDGQQAIESLAQGKEYDLVLSDMEMPEADGFDVIESLRKSYSKSELPLIILTASPYSERVVRALKAGANDFIDKANDFEVIVARVETQLSLKQTNKELSDYAENLRQLNEIKDRELEIAWEIQKELLPDYELELERYDIGLCYRPTTKLGGDFYNFIQFEEAEKNLVCLADAAGHGVPAALLSALFKAQSDLVLDGSRDLGEAINILNERLHELLPSGKFISTFFLLLDHNQSRAEFIKCSQEPGLLFLDGLNVKTLETNGVLLGAFGPEMLSGGNYFETCSISLREGDRVVLYTDGVTEAETSEGEQYGETRFYDLLQKNNQLSPDELSEKVLAAVQDFTGRQQLEDDFSVLVVDVCE